MHTSKENKALVEAAITIGHSLGLPTTAEGVEEPEQMSRLAEHGCDFGQGFLFGRPMEAGEVPLHLSGTAGKADRRFISAA